jgi:O-antigen/teichoic acid export membrane protein
MNQTSVFRQLFSLSRDSIVYGLSLAISQFVGFLLIPLYTSYLRPADYGTLEVLNTTSSLLGVVVAMGLASALTRSYFRSEGDEGRRVVVSTVVVFLTATSFVFMLALQALASHISSLLFDSSQYTTYLRIIFLSMFFNTGSSVALAVFRARGQPVKYAAAAICQFILSVVLNIVFVVGLRMGVEGILYAGLITAVSVYVVLMTNLVRQVGIRWSGNQLKTLLAFGLPLVPSNVGGWILTMADRYFLLLLTTEAEVGLYSLGYKLGLVIQALLVGPFQLAWLPFLFSTAKEKRAGETYSRVFTYFVMVALFAALVISVLAKEALLVMAKPDFRDAYKVVPLVAASYVMWGCYDILAVGIYLEGKTKYLPALIGVAAVLNLGLNLLLIPDYGMMGAAAATLASYVLLPAGAYLISRRYRVVHYEWGRAIKILLAVTLIYVASIFVDRSYSAMHSHMSATYAHLIVGGAKVLLLLCYPILLYAIGFFRPEEIHMIRTLARSAPGYVARRLGRKPNSPDGPADAGG